MEAVDEHGPRRRDGAGELGDRPVAGRVGVQERQGLSDDRVTQRGQPPGQLRVATLAEVQPQHLGEQQLGQALVRSRTHPPAGATGRDARTPTLAVTQAAAGPAGGRTTNSDGSARSTGSNSTASPRR